MKPTEAEIYDARGNRIPGDIVPDGGRVRVSMLLMDGMPDIAEITRRALADASDADDGIMHKPGPIRSKLSDAIAATQEILRDARSTSNRSFGAIRLRWKSRRTPPRPSLMLMPPPRDVTSVSAMRGRQVRDATPDQSQAPATGNDRRGGVGTGYLVGCHPSLVRT
jgi:hypothetical protein